MAGMKEFRARFESDTTFAEKFANVTSGNEVLAIAKANGYDLTADNFKNEILSDEELDNVAGGICWGDIMEFLVKALFECDGDDDFA